MHFDWLVWNMSMYQANLFWSISKETAFSFVWWIIFKKYVVKVVKLFYHVYTGSSQHSESWKKSWQLYKPKTVFLVLDNCREFSQFPCYVFRWGYVSKKKVLLGLKLIWLNLHQIRSHGFSLNILFPGIATRENAILSIVETTAKFWQNLRLLGKPYGMILKNLLILVSSI